MQRCAFRQVVSSKIYIYVLPGAPRWLSALKCKPGVHGQDRQMLRLKSHLRTTVGYVAKGAVVEPSKETGARILSRVFTVSVRHEMTNSFRE